MHSPKIVSLGMIAMLVSALSLPAWAHDPNTPEGKAAADSFMADHEPAIREAPLTGAAVSCTNGMAGEYPCKNVDLLSVLPLNSIGGGNGNDIWGWTDPTSGKEYAIMGRTNGTAFVDVSSPTNPVYLGNLPSHGGSSSWRDIKVYKDHAFVVADFISGHGMQVFDLTRLRAVTSPQTFTEDAHYAGFGPAHNIAINEATGFAYAVGSNTCSGGPHMVNIANPTAPVAAGCVAADGYTHDTQCVVYTGPDADYSGREICMNSNEDTVTVVDVTDKANPVQISRTGYVGAAYSHQGWFTEDQKQFILDDELDEQGSRTEDQLTKTYVFDMTDLDRPVLTGTHNSSVTSIDHNQYVKGNYSYQANYQAGLRILDLANVGSGQLSEAGYFDIYPSGNAPEFNGAWSVYPYFASGTVVISGIEQGLVVVKPNLDGGSSAPTTFTNSSQVKLRGGVGTSSIDVTGVEGSAPSALEVSASISAKNPSALTITLVAPDGTARTLKAAGAPAQATYTVDASSSPANGTWQLRVTESARGKASTISSWELRF